MSHAATQAAPPSASRAWEVAYPGTPGQLAQVRADLRSLLAGCPLAVNVVSLVSELAANAVTHSDSGQPGGAFTVRLQRHSSHIRVEVQDQGSSWDGDLATAARRPHGLYLLLTLATRCGTSRAAGSRTIWFRIDYPPFPPRPPAQAVPDGSHQRPRGSPMDTPQPPPHPLYAMTTFELRDYRLQLERALASLPGHAPSRDQLQQRLNDVVAEQDSRATAARDRA